MTGKANKTERAVNLLTTNWTTSKEMWLFEKCFEIQRKWMWAIDHERKLRCHETATHVTDRQANEIRTCHAYTMSEQTYNLGWLGGRQTASKNKQTWTTCSDTNVRKPPSIMSAFLVPLFFTYPIPKFCRQDPKFHFVNNVFCFLNWCGIMASQSLKLVMPVVF